MAGVFTDLEFERPRRKRIERKCVDGCGATVYAPKVRCQPCGGARLVEQSRKAHQLRRLRQRLAKREA